MPYTLLGEHPLGYRIKQNATGKEFVVPRVVGERLLSMQYSNQPPQDTASRVGVSTVPYQFTADPNALTTETAEQRRFRELRPLAEKRANSKIEYARLKGEQKSEGEEAYANLKKTNPRKLEEISRAMDAAQAGREGEEAYAKLKKTNPKKLAEISRAMDEAKLDRLEKMTPDADIEVQYIPPPWRKR